MAVAHPAWTLPERQIWCFGVVTGKWGLVTSNASLRRENAEWLHAVITRATLPQVSWSGNSRVSLREPARRSKRPVGPGTHPREDEGLPMAETRAGRAVRVRGMDSGQSSAALAFHGCGMPLSRGNTIVA